MRLEMIKVHTSYNWVIVHHMKNTLEAAGIACQIKNDQMGKQADEVLSSECWPELWIMNEEHLEEAKALVDECTTAVEKVGNQTECDHCGAELELNFSFCLLCGADKGSGH